MVSPPLRARFIPWPCAPHPVFFATGLFLLVCAALPAEAAPPAGYYATVDTSNPFALATTLHDVIDDHTRFPYTSSATDTWDILELAQEDPGDAGAILDVYRNESYPKQGGGNVFYQREHIWPRSFGIPNDRSDNYPYSDAHMLRLADGSYNGSRSNRPYGTCDASCVLRETVANAGQGGGSDPYPGDDNWYRSSGGLGGLLGRWETWSGRRGDIARAMLYADIRYEGDVHGLTGVAEPDLVLTDDESLIVASNTGFNEPVAYMGLLSVLLGWHVDDPVDDFERNRNDIVFSFQGNRNPFVDHPEWVDLLFEAPPCMSDLDCDDGVFCNGIETCSLSGVCEAGADACLSPLVCSEAEALCLMPAEGREVWINEIHYDNASTDTGEFFEIAGTAGVSLAGWSLVGYNGSNGSVYDTIALSGTLPMQDGCGGTLDFAMASMQNGSPDGLALVNAQGDLVEFISYEGVFTATAGAALGESSVDLGVSETSSTPVGDSLQLGGAGRLRSDFTWTSPASATRGLPNNGQSFSECAVTPVPTSSVGLGRPLLAIALLVAALLSVRPPLGSGRLLPDGTTGSGP